MKLKLTTSLVVAVLASTLLLGCNKEAKVVDLGVVTEQNVNATLTKPEKPTVVLVTGKDCADCAATEHLLKQVAAERSDVSVVKVENGLVNAPAGFVAFAYPKLGVTTFGQPSALKSATEVNSFINARMANAKLRQEAAEAIKALDQKMRDAGKPFQERIDAVSTRADESNKELSDRVYAVEEAIQLASKPFDEQFNELRKKKREALAELNRQYEEAEAALQAAYEPYRKEAGAIEDELKKVNEPLDKEMQQLRMRALQLRNVDSTALPK